jgi:hypothetical protein
MPTMEVRDDSDDDEILLNPAARFKFDDDEMAAYLMSHEIDGKKSVYAYRDRDYRKDSKKPIRKTFKGIVFAYKDGGKTQFIHTIPQLDKNHPTMKSDLELSQVKYLLEEDLLQSGWLLEIGDAEGKADLMSIPKKFEGYPIRYRFMFHPGGPMPAMQDPVAFVKEFILFVKSVNWAHNNPEKYRELTKSAEYPDGIDPPNAFAFENYSILTNIIMDYVSTISYDDNIDKLEKRSQELGAPMIPNFKNYYIRNCNWDYKGILTQASFLHYVASARARTKWKGGKPTDEEDLDLYAKATYAFNFVVYLWRETDLETNKPEFYGQIVSSDFMDEDTVLEPIRNPTYPKVVAQLVKLSHSKFLDKAGKWKKANIKGEEKIIWVKNPTKKVTKKK